MDEQGLLRFLKRPGKKTLVAEGLVDQVRQHETYLVSSDLSGVAAAGEQDIRGYTAQLTASARKNGCERWHFTTALRRTIPWRS